MPTYPNKLNLDKLNMSNSPIGDVDLGKYFNIEFPGYTTSPNTTPILSYGKHIFIIGWQRFQYSPKPSMCLS